MEFGSPFKIGGYRGGFYTFFSAQDSKSYYKGISTRDKLGQIAFDMELPKKFRMEAGMQGFGGVSAAEHWLEPGYPVTGG